MELTPPSHVPDLFRIGHKQTQAPSIFFKVRELSRPASSMTTSRRERPHMAAALLVWTRQQGWPLSIVCLLVTPRPVEMAVPLGCSKARYYHYSTVYLSAMLAG